MNHLSDEQLDELPADGTTDSTHLASCEACRARLAQRRAIRQRLAAALANVAPSADLAERIRRQSAEAGASGARRHPLVRRLWPALAAAAALLAAVIPLAVYFGSPPPAAAGAELARIHEQNLSHGHNLFTSDDPADLAGYFREELGFAPAVPRLGQGMSMRGCCVSHFRGEPVGSYVVETAHGFVSIIVLKAPAESLEHVGSLQRGPRTYYLAAFAQNRMAAVNMGPYAYCAVGEASHEWLAGLLEELLPAQ